MVADLCHFVFSLFRGEVEKTKRRKIASFRLFISRKDANLRLFVISSLSRKDEKTQFCVFSPSSFRLRHEITKWHKSATINFAFTSTTFALLSSKWNTHGLSTLNEYEEFTANKRPCVRHTWICKPSTYYYYMDFDIIIMQEVITVI